MTVRRLMAWACLGLAVPAVAGEELPAEAKARLRNVEQSLDDWDITGAKRELGELEKLAPKDIEPVQYFGGRIAFEEGRYADAVKLLQAAGIEDKPGSYLRLALDTQHIMEGHARAESEHFVFFYPKGKDELLAPWALETLEAQRAVLEKALGYAPPGKVRVEIVANAKELSRTSTLTATEIETTGTIAICKFSKLIVTSPKAVPHGYDWQDTLAHEYTHLVVSQKSHNTVPIWLHEGIAKYFESGWRGAPGLALTPANIALLGERVRKDKLVPFEKMHPSIALLPTAEDAATAFAEVFYAIDYIYKQHGAAGVRTVIETLAHGEPDKVAVERATGMSFPAFEKTWLAYVRKQPFPRELLPHDRSMDLASRVRAGAKGSAKATDKPKDKEFSFGDFAEIEEPEARKLAHLGELFRERNRLGAATEEFGRAHQMVGNKYETVSNEYALVLMATQRLDEAQKVLEGSLSFHPGSPTTHVHLGRVFLARKDLPKARDAYLGALAADPFDEEIHFALAGIYDVLQAKALKEREQHAAALLTGLAPDKVTQVSKRLLANEPPPPPPKAKETPRQTVEAVGPSRGPADAPVTIIEFSDFECPFCRRAHDTLDQVLAAYPGKIRLVFRQLPLEVHPHAEAAAQAALCANEQGHFWEYHDALFGRQAHLERDDLLENAAAVGLDAHAFTQCLESGRTLAQMRADETAAQKLGLSATPSFFVNGVPLSGALPLSEFKRTIDEELGAN